MFVWSVLIYLVCLTKNSSTIVYGGTGYSTITLKIEPQALNQLNQVVATLD